VLVAHVMIAPVIHAIAVSATHATAHQRLTRRLDVVEIRKLKLQRKVDVVEIRKPKLQRRLDVAEIRNLKFLRSLDVVVIRNNLNHKISQKLPSQSEVKRSQSRLKTLSKQQYQNLDFLHKLILLHNIIL